MRQISGLLSAQWLDVERERGNFFFFLKKAKHLELRPIFL